MDIDEERNSLSEKNTIEKFDGPNAFIVPVKIECIFDEST